MQLEASSTHQISRESSNLCFSYIINCVYTNITNYPQIVRIEETSQFYLERAVMPGQRLSFRAPCESNLLVMGGESCSMMQIDTIACRLLKHS